MLRAPFMVLMLILTCGIAYTGQMSSHDYTAVLAKNGLTGTALKAVEGNEDAYLSGAQGPDTTGVVQYTFDDPSLHRSVGDETHYDKQKAELALNILDAARKDPARIAFAIGWISHYINDIHVHKVVNNYGGYFKFYAKHHKALEQLETKYIMTKYPSVEDFTRSHVRYDKLGDRFADFIFDAYHTTYPQNVWYDQGNVGWRDTADKRAYFCSRFNAAAGWSYSAHDEFYRSATYKDAGGQHRNLSGGIIFPNMPSFEQYAKLLNAIEITNVRMGKDKLICTVRVHDSRMYGRFLVDWQAAADQSVKETRLIYPIISAYLDQSNPVAKAALRKRLLDAIPSVSLDNPLEEIKPDSDFQPPKVFPGDQSFRTPLYTCVFQPTSDKGAGATINGTVPAMIVKVVGWAGSEDGQNKLEIPVPRGVYPYKFTLKVAIAKRTDFANSAYLKRSWAQVTGALAAEKAPPINNKPMGSSVLAKLQQMKNFSCGIGSDDRDSGYGAGFPESIFEAPTPVITLTWNGTHFTYNYRSIKSHQSTTTDAQNGKQVTVPYTQTITSVCNVSGVVSPDGKMIKTLSISAKHTDISTSAQFITSRSATLRNIPLKEINSDSGNVIFSVPLKQIPASVVSTSFHSSGYMTLFASKYITEDKQQKKFYYTTKTPLPSLSGPITPPGKTTSIHVEFMKQ